MLFRFQNNIELINENSFAGKIWELEIRNVRTKYIMTTNSLGTKLSLKIMTALILYYNECNTLGLNNIKIDR